MNHLSYESLVIYESLESHTRTKKEDSITGRNVVSVSYTHYLPTDMTCDSTLLLYCFPCDKQYTFSHFINHVVRLSLGVHRLHTHISVLVTLPHRQYNVTVWVVERYWDHGHVFTEIMDMFSLEDSGERFQCGSIEVLGVVWRSWLVVWSWSSSWSDLENMDGN